MGQIKWITPPGSIGTITENEYFEFQLDSYNTSGPVPKYTMIAGPISPGLELSSTGLIHGIPYVTLNPLTQQSFTQEFAIRAYDPTTGSTDLADRTFTITLNPVALPQIYPSDASLGTFQDGTLVDMPLLQFDVAPLTKLTWTLVDGEIPLGTMLTEDGRLYGYILPSQTTPAGLLIGWDLTSWDNNPWDLITSEASSKNYAFTVQVYDGSRIDKTTYSITVVAASSLTVDSTEILIDNDNIVINDESHHTPYITNPTQYLPIQRELSKFAYQIVGADLDNDVLNYEMITPSNFYFTKPLTPVKGDQWWDLVNNQILIYSVTTFSTSDGNTIPSIAEWEILIPSSELSEVNLNEIVTVAPAGLSINQGTGWITGILSDLLSSQQKTYVFQVQCWKTLNPSYVSIPTTFILTVLGNKDDIITWITPTLAGTVNEGSISDLSIVATSSLGYEMKYQLIAGSLPNGLSLLSDGLIIGQVPFTPAQDEAPISNIPLTFDISSIVPGATTFDDQTTAFDSEYQFTVQASDIGNTIFNYKTFTIKISTFNVVPYENLYLKALTSREQRLLFLSFINDQDIFPDQLIYRKNDPWFGKSVNMKFLFAAGLSVELAEIYIANMQNNHYNKIINLGNIKTAVALDENFNIKYEVVYIEVTDPETVNGVSPPMSISTGLPPPNDIIYPNSFINMKDEVDNVGYVNRGALPGWMLSTQPNGLVLGFTFGVVLAYTVPGASNLIAYRLQQSGISMNDLDFTVDRYQLDVANGAGSLPEEADQYLKFPKVTSFGPENY